MTATEAPCHAIPCPDVCKFHPWCQVHRRHIDQCVEEKAQTTVILRRMVLRGPCMPMLQGPNKDEQAEAWLDEKVALEARGMDSR